MTSKRKDQIRKLLKGIETGDPESVSVVNEDKYIQHNPLTPEGSEGLAELFKRLAQTSPRVDIVRIFADGDYVFAHTDYNFNVLEIGFEVFRFEGDLAVEHWDNLQHKHSGPNRSGHTMIDGPTEVTDLDKTDFNRELVRSFVDTYDSERLKTLNVWSMFTDDDLGIRPHPALQRDRNALEHMIHQCLGENKWFVTMLGIDVGAPPLPEQESQLEFIKRYADDSGKRVAVLQDMDEAWWAEEVTFFDTMHSRAWIMVRRIAHTAHHRGEMTTLLRLLNRQVHSVYGPTIDTGGLPQNQALTIYAYPDIDALIEGESQGGRKADLPGPGDKPSTERPDLMEGKGGRSISSVRASQAYRNRK